MRNKYFNVYDKASTFYFLCIVRKLRDKFAPDMLCDIISRFECSLLGAFTVKRIFIGILTNTLLIVELSRYVPRYCGIPETFREPPAV